MKGKNMDTQFSKCYKELQQMKKGKITKKNFSKLMQLLQKCGTDADWNILKSVVLKESLEEAINVFSVVDMIVNKELYENTKVLLQEAALPDLKKAKEIQKQIDKLINSAPKGGFMDPNDEKQYWKIINDLYDKLDKIVKR